MRAIIETKGVVGRHVTFGAKNETAVVRAVFLDTEQNQPAVVLERTDKFGRPRGGHLVTDFLGEVSFEPTDKV